MEKPEENLSHFQFTDFDSWRKALNKAPNSKWILERSIGGNKKSKYIPLFVQQALADVFFREFDIVNHDIMVVANEIIVSVKIHFLPDYPDAQHRTMTGVAAKPIQQDSQTSPSSFPTGKKTNACEYNVPASKSAAISNALTSFANVFGKNLNRDVRNDYSLTEKKEKQNEKQDEK